MSDERRLNTLLGLFIALVAAAVFYPTLDAELLNWDDNVYITENPALHDSSWRNLPDILTHRQLGVYNPLPILLFWSAHSLWGDAPLGYHALTVAFHAANAALVFALVLLLTRRRFLAFACALLWAVHPLRVEAVAWACQLKETLGSFFFLCTLILYLTRARSRSAYALSLVTFACALLCKPIYVTLPAVILLLDLCADGRVTRPALIRAVPFILLAAASAVLSLVLVQEASDCITDNTPVERITSAVRLLGFYALKTLWPARLTVTYPAPPPAVLSAGFLVSALGLGIVAAFCLMLFRRRRPLPLLAFGFYVIALSPTLGLVPYPGEICSDRYTYLASVGLTLLFLLPLDLAVRRSLVSPLIALIFVLAVGAPLVRATLTRAETWHDSISLWSTQVHVAPNDPIAWNNYGCAHRQQGDWASALHDFNIARRLAPRATYPRSSIASIYFDRGEFKKALYWYREAAHLGQNDAAFWINLGSAELVTGHPAEAVAALEKARAFRPDDPAVLALYAKALQAAGRSVDAIAAYSRALELEPGLFFAHIALADIYAAQPGQTLRAIEHYRKGVELGPPAFPDVKRAAARLRELEQPRKP